ncbi:unnamed protein product [Cladocopium goreaui]|uniref:Uncharacterized protein n=1 Tax=Cladocopium goreaui TaxID=2562237 RepID=A0A9P1FGU1_9DINO|nr:unnamed protein product [Cladocopium goreaui]
MELSVHVNPSLRQTRQRTLPRGLQDRYASSVRQYLTQAMLQKGKELNSRRPVPRPCLIGSECQVRDPGCWSSVETDVG